MCVCIYTLNISLQFVFSADFMLVSTSGLDQVRKSNHLQCGGYLFQQRLVDQISSMVVLNVASGAAEPVEQLEVMYLIYI